jgi:hypothetical protein
MKTTTAKLILDIFSDSKKSESDNGLTIRGFWEMLQDMRAHTYTASKFNADESAKLSHILQDKFIKSLLERQTKLEEKFEKCGKSLETLLEIRVEIANINLQTLEQLTTLDQEVTSTCKLKEVLSKANGLLKTQEEKCDLSKTWWRIDFEYSFYHAPAAVGSPHSRFFSSNPYPVNISLEARLQSLFKAFENGMSQLDLAHCIGFYNCVWSQEKFLSQDYGEYTFSIDSQSSLVSQLQDKNDVLEETQEENTSLRMVFKNFYEKQYDLVIKEFEMELAIHEDISYLETIFGSEEAIPGIDGLFIS